MKKFLRKCPKCRSNNLILTETVAASKTVNIVNGIFDENSYNGEYGNAIHPIQAECCNCGHQWNLRGIYDWFNNKVSKEI